MKKAAMTLVLAILGSLAALFIAGDACDNVPLMRWTDACLKACSGTPLYPLCQETLHGAPYMAEVTAYAILAARVAKRSYDDTMGRAERLVAGGSLPADERPAYLHCIDSYATARIQMVSVITELVNCDFTHARQEYADAVAAMESCRQGLSVGTPLAAMNAADRDATIVAYDLGALIVGR